MDHWERYLSLEERMTHILETGFESDCTFYVGSTNPRQFKCHKIILAIASPVFHAMLYGDMAKDNITIDDVDPDAFHDILRYAYNDQTQYQTVEAAYPLYYAATKYLIPSIQDDCVSYIKENLSPSNVLQAYEFSKFYEITELKEKCLQFMSEQTEAVLEEESFKSAELQSVVDMFGLPKLNISSEVVLLRAAEEYHAAHSQDTTPSGPCIRQALQHIRFLTLSAQNFTDQVYKSTLLSLSEKYNMLMNISHPGCKETVPEGFSLCRELRSYQVSLEGIKHCYIKIKTDVERHKRNVVFNICETIPLVVVFSINTSYTDDLERRDRPAYFIHNDIEKAKREKLIQDFYDNTGVMIALTWLATSIDMKRVCCVINYNLPPHVAGYIHTVAWNCACQGLKPITINLIQEEQMPDIRRIEEYFGIEMKEISLNDDVVQAVEQYIKS